MQISITRALIVLFFCFFFTCKTNLTLTQERSQEFAVGGGLFWRLQTKSDDIDPDFDWASLRLAQI